MKPGRALRGWLGFEALMKLCCCLALLGVSQGQFFSKTTNTIPRMGRRDLDYAQLEEPRMGLFRAIPARQSASMVDLGYLDGVTEDRAREKQVDGCHGGRCRAAVLHALQTMDDV
ncbi:uncharacterized protein LOC119171602 [Rhipicephalus microplus]|uniref:uncharacterized protein LOC119171602 n=1 Tax=Rhipicephalus microplus TaxID=6941 RepID=UPI001888A793|nr:uncharacterized protein LOC119171602 [Rhipicephalus microplus]UKD60460.1 ETH [Rhipicephalus microplus]